MEWVELETFFSGYLLVYAIVSLAGSKQRGFEKARLLTKLPLAYAFSGTLYVGLQLKNAYADYSIGHFTVDVQLSYLKLWGLISVLFWTPLLRRKAVFSLLHSSVFFFLLMKSLFSQHFANPPDKNMVRNNMKIYSVSVLLNLASLILVMLFSMLMAHFKRQKRSDHI